MFLRPPPELAIRHVMVGPDAPASLVRRVRDVLGRVPAHVLAHRLDAIAHVDVPCTPRCPVHVLVPRGDRMVPPQDWPGCTVHEVDGPHLLAQRHPHIVGDLVRSLL